MRSGIPPAPPIRLAGILWLAGSLLLLASPLSVLAQARREGPPANPGAAARPPVIPGWGQRTLEQRRGIVYAVAEAAFWTLWAERRHKGNTLRTAYRDLAWREGRIQVGARTDPDWAYFEAVSKWTRSGAFDRDPSAVGLQPEVDPTTFNGSVWRLAVDLYFPRGADPSPEDPSYPAALNWYSSHAYGGAFLWDWSGKDRQLAEYNDLIHRSDRRFSQATGALGAVLANHLLSATDAFVSSRVPGDAGFRVRPPSPGDDSRFGLILSWNPPR